MVFLLFPFLNVYVYQKYIFVKFEHATAQIIRLPWLSACFDTAIKLYFKRNDVIV